MLNLKPYPVSPDILQRASLLGLNYLLNNIHDAGAFTDARTLANNHTTHATAQTHTHACALYILYQQLTPEQLQFSAHKLQSAERYLQDHCTSTAQQALTLLALTERYKIQPNPQTLDTMRHLATQLAQATEGEAILALTRLHALDPNPDLLQCIKISADHQLSHPVRDKKFVRGHNPWFATALPEVYTLLPHQPYRDECWLIADSTVSSVNTEPQTSLVQLATRGETIIAAIHFIRTLQQSGLATTYEVSKLTPWIATCDNILSQCLAHLDNHDYSIEDILPTLTVIRGRLMAP